MSSSQKLTKKDSKVGKNEEAKTSQKQLTLDATRANSEGNESVMLTELRKFRQESGLALKDIMDSQKRMEESIKEVNSRMDSLEQRLSTTESRVSDTEDRGMRLERALAYLLNKDAKITARQEDMENRLRRNNIRVYGIPEDEEKDVDMIQFVTELFRTSLKLQEDLNIRLERAHRATISKPKGTAPPRSIIIRFLDFSVKQVVLQQAWKQREVLFRGKKSVL